MTDTPEGRPAILIIDDDEQVRKLLTQLLRTEHDCTAVSSAEEALAVLDARNFDLVISDINMKGITGLELVPRILAKDPDSVVVMISGQQTIEYAIEPIQAGALAY